LHRFTLAAAAVLTALAAASCRRGVEPISRFGEYRGYSERDYDGYQRRSAHVTLRDGTRLAYDLLLPTRAGQPAREPLPVLFSLTPYLRTLKLVDDGHILGADLFELGWHQRAFLWLRAKLSRDGHLLDPVFRTPWLQPLLEHGYAVVVVERPGTGASFGSVHPSWEVGASEADQLLGWIAAQPWSDGNIGMFGDSYEAMTQYAAASTGNPHLKAIFPCSSSFDFYDGLFYPGGIFNTGFAGPLPRALAVLERMAVPVDDDPDGALLERALSERRERTLGRVSSDAFHRAGTRDARRAGGSQLWQETSLYPLLDRINRAGVPVYNSNGWHDLFARDVLLWHVNLRVPRLLHVRPLHHKQMNKSGPDLDYGAEAHRWFDYWLKGIDNGIMQEAPVRYWLMGAPEERAWQTAPQWPPASRPLRLYLSADATLRSQSPLRSDAHDRYVVDYATTSGVDSRWHAFSGSGTYQDMRANDASARIYTTEPLVSDLEVTGHPVVHLWVRSDAPDFDLFVYLEEIGRDGSSRYVTEGSLRASHRARRVPPFDKLGLPFHRSYREDLAPVPAGEPIELVFDLQPTAQLFRRGQRLRIAITGADADNFETPPRDPAPRIDLLRGSEYASWIELPAIAGSD
jgi:putative CocE/NonD family hydrolase